MGCVGILVMGTFGAGALAAGLATGSGGDRADRTRSADPLVVGLDFVVPPHQPGAKVRTPATIDNALAADLARRLDRPLVLASPEGAGEVAGAGAVDVRITTLVDPRRAPASTTAIALDYRAAPMAIMRTDSKIRRWEQLRGRTVCVAEGSAHVGALQGRYGAIEFVRSTLAEALLDLRTGGCDAMVHDSVLLEELLRLPEWKKFSRRLAGQPRSTLALLVPKHDAQAVSRARQIAKQWKAASYADTLVRTMARDVAFEVYLEQEVPDCH